jgi:hypothetical protein
MFNRLVAAAAILFTFQLHIKADDLNIRKMEQVTKDIIEIFVSDKYPDKSVVLRQYISDEWLEKKRLNVNKYLINNYSPTKYEIIYSGSDICAATIGGDGWTHLLVFKFVEEGPAYRVIPKGISSVNNEYIDP